MASPASFGTQANALLRKNLTYQKRKVKANIGLILLPVILLVLLTVLQSLVDNYALKDTNDELNKCNNNKEYDNSNLCAIHKPLEWPPLLQIPYYGDRAVRTNLLPYSDLPDKSCRKNDSSPCPVTMLFTASNFSFAQSLLGNIFTTPFSVDPSDGLASLAMNAVGTEMPLGSDYFIDPAFTSGSLHYLQNQCKQNFTFILPATTVSRIPQEVKCVQGLLLWRNGSSIINDEIYKGHVTDNTGQTNEIAAAFDLLNSNSSRFSVSIWYDSTNKQFEDNGINSFTDNGINLVRVPRSVNLISNAYLLSVLGSSANILFEFVKEMPKHKTIQRFEIASVLGSLFFTWIILQPFPIALTSLVYEKEQKLRIMMKMHGLGDGPYWIISYGYFLAISVIYMLCFVIFGSLLGIKFFTLNDYSIQFVFYFIYVNVQVLLAFLAATMFSNVKTAAVTAYLATFGTGLLGQFLFQSLITSASFPRKWIIVMELYPGFGLYRGLYEFAESSKGDGMRWEDLSDSTNGMKEVLIIMFVEWIMLLFVSYYIYRGRGENPKGYKKKHPSRINEVLVHLEKSDVMQEDLEIEKPIQEREKVEQLVLGPTSNHAIVCDELKKVYPGKDGNPEKFAVRGLSLAVPQGECFGMLGPNGAGKTSFISMMIGLTKPSSGTAYVEGLDIRTQMNGIYTNMGVCPQQNLLWDSLTGREHLLFYGRLKNLKGLALTQAVEESLKNLNIFHGGVADKRAGRYSGGMKRRLSVAISLIGDPKVVYMDEPSTGLDPASRNSLWNVVKRAKQGRAIILTTHSMEEAEVLCDRLGIFVNGSLQCIGNPNELKRRYGGTYVFTMTTSSDHEKDVENIVQQLSPNAKKIYHLSGTQKFELPKEEVRIANVFQAVENAKRKFAVSAWGLADTRMEDVFIKVARGAEESIALENRSSPAAGRAGGDLDP